MIFSPRVFPLSGILFISLAEILLSGSISICHAYCHGLNIKNVLNLIITIIIIYITVNMININVTGIWVCLIWINGFSTLILSNESSESLDIIYSDTKKSVYFWAVMYSNILLSTLVHDILFLEVPLKVIKYDPFKWVSLTVFSPFTKMAPSWITSTLLFFSRILLQKNFFPFSNHWRY